MLTWEMLFRNGSLFDLDVGAWSGQVRLKPSDLGIEDTPEVRKAINMAHARLVAKEHIDDIRRLGWEGRREIETRSIIFPLVQGASFVPRSKREELEARLEELKILFEARKSVFLASYDNIRSEMEPVLRNAILDVAVDTEKAQKGIARVLSMYPDRFDVERKFYFEWRAFAISAPIDGTVSEELQNASGDVKNALQSMIEGLRNQVVEKVNGIVDLITRGGKYSAKTVNSAKALISRVRQLNVLNDNGLDRALVAFSNVLVTYEGGGSTEGFETIRTELQENLDQAMADAEDRLMSLNTGREIR